MIILRTIGLLIALAAMVSFGACGALGLLLGTQTSGSFEFLVYGFIGLGIAGLIAWGIFSRMRLGRARRVSAPPRQ
ncbi:hypothetical protein [Massilia pseudoviolaceinigra]|uniref:hypothetical protein n=1 Tax=Massilia pseudoviolaceinigra TaxID=3057165 RepID=UPI0027964C1E|nr:hypothetical protein [Massilia sp. CCM 9206]MDQ1922191.1 hypothetical protein [Massilia sp. CCM 9206]